LSERLQKNKIINLISSKGEIQMKRICLYITVKIVLIFVIEFFFISSSGHFPSGNWNIQINEDGQNKVIEEHESIKSMFSFEKMKGGIIFHCITTSGKNIDVTVNVNTSKILRLQMCPDAELKNVKSLLEIKEDWPSCNFNVKENDETVSVETDDLRLVVYRDPWKYVIYNREGEVVLQEHVKDIEVTGNCRSLPLGFTTEGGKFKRVNETFYLTPGENIYGFGERFTRLNKVGQSIDGWNTDPWGSGTKDVHKHIPFMMSTKGYGIFVNTTFRFTGTIGSQSLMAYTLWVNNPKLDIFFIYGPSLKEVLASYEEITGWPSFPPKKSFGIWHTPSWTRSHSVDELVATAKKFREFDIPIDHFSLIIRLATGKGQTDKKQLAFTREISRELGKLGVKTGMYTAPMLNIGSQMEQEARDLNYVLTQENGSPYEALLVNKPEIDFTKREDCSLAAITRSDAWREGVFRETRDACLLPDFTNPDVVKWWKGKIADRIKAGCYAVEMSDFGEEIPTDAHYFNERSGFEMHNIYAQLYQKATYEAVAENSGHRGLVCARSGTAGLQRYPICWSGDPNCEWESMANTLRAGLSIGLSGVPFWSCDNAGFDDEHGHLSPELWIRWSQWSMFLSHVRLHGMGPERAPWTFGDNAVENFRKYAKLRYRLMPYIYSHAYNATKTGLPMMRAMVLDFPDDPNTFNLEDQYMFGDAFLVAPVFTPTNKRTVYLPEGTWYDYETGEAFTGPVTLHIEPPLEKLPLYIRDNSIIPMGPEMEYIGQEPFEPVTLDIRCNSHAEFTLFDDDEEGDGPQEIVTCRAKRDQSVISLDISPSAKTYIAKINNVKTPDEVILNGTNLQRFGSQTKLEKSVMGWCYDPSSILYIRFNASGKENKLKILL
jgi:alpha-D-xyloside xylohydrolase